MCAANEICGEYARTLIRVKAKQLVRQPGFKRSEQRDIEQDLMVHLLAQADRFDPTRSSIDTFVDRVVDSGAGMLVRARKRLKRCPEEGIEIKSLAVVVEQVDEPPAALASLISAEDQERRMGTRGLSDFEAFELADSVAIANAAMPPRLQAICRSLMKGNRTQTARELNLSRHDLESAIAEIRERFTQAGLKKTHFCPQPDSRTA